MTEKVPTQNDIWSSELPMLDELCAVEHFLGKSLEEAEELFAESAIHYGEDLCYMSETGFKYYFKAYDNYVRSTKATNDYSAITQLVTILDCKVDIFKEGWTWNYVADCVDYCLQNLGKFDLGKDFDMIQEKLNHYKNSHKSG